jgi:hypothetical protein
MSGTSSARQLGDTQRDTSKPSSVVQRLFRRGLKSNITSQTEPQFVSKYVSRGSLYRFKKTYTRIYEQGRTLRKEPFAYKPLAQSQIRLLELLPGTSNGVIECRLYYGAIENLPRYEALSYTWGDESSPQLQIIIDEKLFLVKDNLKEALERFRPSTQQKAVENSAEEFLRYWERIRLCLDCSKGGGILIPRDEGELVSAVGGQGQEEYNRYTRLVRTAKELHLPSSSSTGSTEEIVSLMANLDQRRQQLKALWDLHATKEGKARVNVNSRLLWIDAICINQADFDERVAQIKIMRQIYQSASSVVVWLGDDDGDGGTAIELLSRISQKIRNRRKEGAFPSTFLLDEFGVSAPWYSLVFFFSSPWFQRSWVVQECAAGAMSGNSLPMLYYGRSCISWAVLEDLGTAGSHNLAQIAVLVVETWEFHPRHYPSTGDIFVPNAKNPEGPKTCPIRRDILNAFNDGMTEWLRLSACLTAMGTRGAGSTSHRLLFWLMRIRNRQATNSLDKIYSVLGLVLALHGQEEPENAALDALIVDYRASIEDVYSSLVRAIVVKTKSLHVLGACTRRGPLIERTWTPDWTQNREQDLPAFDLSNGGIAARPGSGPTGFEDASGRECNAFFAHDLSTLSAEGIFWNTLSFKTTTVDPTDPAEVYRVAKGGLPDLLAKELLDIWDRSARKNVYTNDLCNTALWHTLLIRYSFGIQYFELYQHCPPSMSWARQFRSALTINNVVDIEIPSSALGVTSRITHRSLDTPEDIIKTLNSAILMLMIWKGSVFVTEKGYIGEGTNRSRPGDIICVLLGCNYPVILRPIAGHYEFFGEIYVHGIMHGEVIRAVEEGKVQSRGFEIH